MDPDVMALFHEVANRSAAEREDYYAQQHVPDAVRAEVESLIGFDTVSGPSLSAYVTGVAEDAVLDAGVPAGRRYGSYRLVRLLGRGGMGAVYEAEQDSPRRSVALKVIKPGLASPDLVRRFQQESQALGRLQHPGIAQIHEAGTANTGFGPQPYFAMELVRGEPLREYAESHQLGTRPRLELMARVCEGVEHAHQRGIIHRDLKPGNILVDEQGQPKILDFGVARVTDGDLKSTIQTDVGQLVGTLAYMSPEQVLADPLELDTRSDVYALGVILYELLAGRLPYDTTGKLHEVMRAIREDDPVPLGSVNRAYRGDIETIVAKALEKDKTRRYGSVAALAGDIRRYLHDEPIVARPPSTAYQLQKFATRHKALVAGVAAVFVVLVAGIIVSTWQATRARRAEQAAAQEAATAKAINEFLQNDLLAQAGASTQARPGTKPDADLKVRTALDRAASRIEGKFAAQPSVEASIRQTIGTTYFDLGLYPEAERQMERALDLRRRTLGEEDPDTLKAMTSLTQVYGMEGKLAQAEPLNLKALEIQRRVLGEEHPETLQSMDNLGSIYRRQGKYPQAETLFTKSLETRRRLVGEEQSETLLTMGYLAELYERQGKYAEAERLSAKVLEVQRRTLGEEHPETLLSMNRLAVMYFRQSQFARAAEVFSTVLGIQRRVLGEEHPDTLTTMSNLSTMYVSLGDYERAEPLRSKALEVSTRVLGETHPNTLTVMANLGNLYTAQGKYSQAASVLNKNLEARRRVLGEEHPDTLSSMSYLATTYFRQGSYSRAEPIAMNVLEIRRRVLGPQHPDTTAALVWVGLIQLPQRKYADAERVMREALSNYDKSGPDNWRRYYSRTILGATLAGQARFADAEPLLLSGYEGMAQREAIMPFENRSALDQGRKWIVQLYQDWGQPEKAAEWRSRSVESSKKKG